MLQKTVGKHNIVSWYLYVPDEV